MSPGRHGRDQAGGRQRRLEGQPGHHGEERIGGGQGAVGKSQGHRHVAGQRLRQQAGHALASDGQRGRRLGGVHRRRGGAGYSSGGRGQQVRHSGGLLGGGRGAQAGVLATYGGEVH